MIFQKSNLKRDYVEKCVSLFYIGQEIDCWENSEIREGFYPAFLSHKKCWVKKVYVKHGVKSIVKDIALISEDEVLTKTESFKEDFFKNPFFNPFEKIIYEKPQNIENIKESFLSIYLYSKDELKEDREHSEVLVTRSKYFAYKFLRRFYDLSELKKEQWLSVETLSGLYRLMDDFVEVIQKR